MQSELSSPPQDGITAVRFAASSNALAVSSWDSTVRVYDVDANRPLAVAGTGSPALGACFGRGDARAFAGLLDGRVVSCGAGGGAGAAVAELGRHDGGVRSVVYSDAAGVLATGGWDAQVCLWDDRAARPEVARVRAPGKVFAMDAVGTTLVVCTSGRHVNVYDLRSPAQPLQRRESSLMHQTRSVACSPDGTNYVVGSIEGRVAVEYLDPSPEAQARRYAFKCHRRDVAGVQTLYPVNAVAFHPRYGTFATGGGDGAALVWDGRARKRICRYPAAQTSVAALGFNRDGTLLAVAASYAFEEGDKPHPADAVIIRSCADGEVRPKPTPAA